MFGGCNGCVWACGGVLGLGMLKGLICVINHLKINRLNIWYIINFPYLCNTEMNGKRKAPAVHLLRLDRGKVIKTVQSY